MAPETEIQNRATKPRSLGREDSPDVAGSSWAQLGTNHHTAQPPSCGSGSCTSGSRNKRVCWKTLMAGSGISCEPDCGGNGSAFIHGPQNLMGAGLCQGQAWQSATNGHGAWWNRGDPHMHLAVVFINIRRRSFRAICRKHMTERRDYEAALTSADCLT
jgi:hypothetical protein